MTRGGYFLNALAKVDRQSIKVRGDVDGVDAKFDGTSYGGQLEVGDRTEGDGMAYEKLLSVNYVSTRLDDTTGLGRNAWTSATPPASWPRPACGDRCKAIC
jgi:hypothetical protein